MSREGYAKLATRTYHTAHTYRYPLILVLRPLAGRDDLGTFLHGTWNNDTLVSAGELHFGMLLVTLQSETIMTHLLVLHRTKTGTGRHVLHSNV